MSERARPGRQVVLIPGCAPTDRSPGACSIAEMNRRLGGDFRLRQAGTRRSEHWCFFDTFDWRLLGRDLVCLLRDDVIELRDADSLDLLLSTQGTAPKDVFMPEALPESELRYVVTDAARLRALIKVAAHDVTVVPYRVTDDIGKGIAEAECVRPADGRGLLLLRPLRGYDLEVGEFRARACTDTASVRVAERLLAAPGGREPGAYGSRVSLVLDPTGTCGDAMRSIVDYFADVLVENVPGIIGDWDTEFLHDYRVTLRRLRTVISLSRKVLSRDEDRCMKEDLLRLMSITGRVRDLDVLLLNETVYHDMLPPLLRPGIREYFSWIRVRREIEIRELVHTLGSHEHAHVPGQWIALITGGAWPSGERSQQPVLPRARRWIGRRIAAISQELARAQLGDDPEILHALRIDCKKLRYLLEIYGSLFTSPVVSQLTRDLRRFQDVLGRLQDITVQEQTLADMLELMRSEGRNDIRVAASIGGLFAAISGGRPALVKELRSGIRQFQVRASDQAVLSVFPDAGKVAI